MFDPTKRNQTNHISTYNPETGTYSNGKRPKYCSTKCAQRFAERKRQSRGEGARLNDEQRAERRKLKKKCDECGKEMLAYRYECPNKMLNYCSYGAKSCESKARMRKQKKSPEYEAHLARCRQKTKENQKKEHGRNCVQCGEWFKFTIGVRTYKKVSEAESLAKVGSRDWAGRVEKSIPFIYSSQKYCNKKCYTLAMRIAAKSWAKPLVEKVQAVCKRPECSNTFTTTKGRLNRSHNPKRYCSQACSVKHYRELHPEMVEKNYLRHLNRMRNNREAQLKRNTYMRTLRKTSPSYAVACRLRGRVRDALMLESGLKKRMSTEELVGCSFDDLVIHIESKFTAGMNWDVFLKSGGKIHIDHIMPCAAFDLTNEEEQRECFHWSNLQPLWAVDNLKKGKKIV
tara:strand:- start:7213 stop:8409 length:1197 start_codon:yes stop_codon:yes gene_type:complete